MNAVKAAKHLRSIGWSIQGGKGAWYVNHYEEPYTDRQLIKLAHCYTSENKQNSSIKGDVKHYRHRKNRAETRKRLTRQDYDGFGKNNLAKDEDIWSWD